MNKKIIKYLTWIILIAAILILMPGKETMAVSIKYSEFKTSPNYFCLNQGFPFRATENFNEITFTDAKLKEIVGKDVDRDVLKYLISESSAGNYGQRVNVGSYVPQIAIWGLIDSTNSIFTSSSQAKELLAKANAYNNFTGISTVYNPEIVDNKDGSTFAIYYTKTTASVGGTTGTYSNLISRSVTGATRTVAGAQSDRTGHTHKDVYTRNTGATEARVTINYETSRSANFKIYKNIEKTIPVTYYYYYPMPSSVTQTEFMGINMDGNAEEIEVYHIACTKSKQDNICKMTTYTYQDTSTMVPNIGIAFVCSACGYSALEMKEEAWTINKAYDDPDEGHGWQAYEKDRNMYRNSSKFIMG